jgi:uncharacterized iron-regulated membrane protein
LVLFHIGAFGAHRRKEETMRRFFVWLHRWVGLAMAAFLIVVGLTGSLLAFNDELERVFAPQLFATPRPGAPLPLAELAERAQAFAPGGAVGRVAYEAPDQVLVEFLTRETSADFDQLFLDPWTGAELGRRKRGDLSQGLVNLMPFVYSLHWSLAAGSTGSLILGVIAIAWTIDCFVGFYLTLPPSTRGFWRKWRPAWLVKRGAGAYRLNFDLHRAGGLWFWALLFVFAWSGVMMNIRPVYDWVTTRVFDYHSPLAAYMSLMERAIPPDRMDWRAAQATGERLMAEQAAARGFVTYGAVSLGLEPELGAYSYAARSSRDLFERLPSRGATYLMFDMSSGAFLAMSQPTGEATGNTVEGWLYALHMARVFGMPYRLLVCGLGVVIAMLAVTGVYIWWKKRRARRIRAARAPTREEPACEERATAPS